MLLEDFGSIHVGAKHIPKKESGSIPCKFKRILDRKAPYQGTSGVETEGQHQTIR